MFKSSKESRVVIEKEFHGSQLSFESGWVAKQAHGSVIARAGDTVILCTVCTAPPREGQSFFPMVCEYQEKSYAAGKIPGGFFKREGRPAEHEILACRLIDRPIRPMFPDGFMDEVQIICTVLSCDEVNEPYTLAICGASAALHISKLPFMGPVAAVRVGRVDGKHIINPTPDELEKSDLDMVVAGTKDSIVMVEGGADFVPENEVLDSLSAGHEEIKKIIAIQDELREKVGVEKEEFIPAEKNTALISKVEGGVTAKVKEALNIKIKHDRKVALAEVKEEFLATYSEEERAEVKGEVSDIFYGIVKNESRQMVINTKTRIDGRELTEVRPIECEVGIIPRAHGSALFTRGETQAIVTTTLGTSVDTQRIDSLMDKTGKERSFMLHYNFPPYCTGEVKMMRGTARREIGHGALAHRAVEKILPGESYPYVVRVVSDVTESNGSSSMASVWGGSLSMMDAGVPVKDAVGGVAMGLIKEDEKVAILTDILGDEDHFGDMDFKVCGNKEGITALQMDIKCKGLSQETMQQALQQAKDGRTTIINEMEKAISKPREDLSKYAPQIRTIKINPDKIRDIIGPGGKTIRSIVETTGVKIDVDDSGTVTIASADEASAKRAIEIVEGLTEEAEIGKIYAGVVKKVVDFGAFVEILPGIEGLVHISQLEEKRVEKVSDIVTEGDEVMVRVLDIDRQGKIRLSRKDALSAANQ